MLYNAKKLDFWGELSMTTIKKSNHTVRKLLTLLLVLVFAFVPLLAGCDLVTLNQGKYLSETVAQWRDVKVTKEDLIRTYNNYGNSTYDSSGEVTKEGIERTIDLLVKRAVLVQYLISDDNGPVVTLTMAQQNEIWQNVYDSINSSIRSVEDDLRLDDDASLSDTTTESDEDSDVSEYSAYKSTYTLEQDSNGDYYLQKVTEDATVENVSKALYDTNAVLTTSEKANIAYTNFKNNYLNYTDKSGYTDRALSKYLNNLIRNEDGRGLSTEPKEAFLREVERIYKIYYDNEILTVFQEQFEDNTSITVDMVQAKFKELYDSQKEQYTLDSSTYKTNMQSTSTTSYYNPSSDVNNWFEVYHLLVGFSDEQTTELDNLKTMLKNGEIILDEYNKAIANVKNATIATNRFTGETMPYSQLLQEVQKALDSLDSTEAKIAKFREFVYAYSTDTSSITAENGMYIPLDSSLDNMVEEFADASRELYNTKQKGAISDYVETQYGFHIIMYTGDVANVVYTDNTNALMAKLDSTLLNNITNKTMLDKVIEQISFDNYANYEESLINQIMSGYDTIYYVNAYKDLYE